ncbi:MAG: CGGC domain-containing protein [Calditrichaceae bacterium]
MEKPLKIGIIICDRYRRCAGGKCFRALENREGAFSIYKNQKVVVAGYTTCDGCPGGNIEYAPNEMKNNGVKKIHFATGMIVGYPPCPYIKHFKEFIEKNYEIEVVMGTHPIPEKYYKMHNSMGTWESDEWQDIIKPVICDPEIRKAYD